MPCLNCLSTKLMCSTTQAQYPTAPHSFILTLNLKLRKWPLTSRKTAPMILYDADAVSTLACTSQLQIVKIKCSSSFEYSATFQMAFFCSIAMHRLYFIVWRIYSTLFLRFSGGTSVYSSVLKMFRNLKWLLFDIFLFDQPRGHFL